MAAAFVYITSVAHWDVARFLRPVTSAGRLWMEPAAAASAGTYTADEQNNIEIYKSTREATVSITSIVYQQDWFFGTYEGKGAGSGFIVNPDGEILIVALIESRRGVENLERILDATNGIGAIWPGPGDMATDMGLAVTQPPHPEVEEQLAQVLTICSSRGVPCAAAAVSVEDAVARVAQGFQVILTPLVRGAAAAVRAQPHPVRPT